MLYLYKRLQLELIGIELKDILFFVLIELYHFEIVLK
jgi:hypothetical protein